MPGISKTMSEFKAGTLRSSSGKLVTDRKQAIAIGISQEREARKGRRGLTAGEAAEALASRRKE